jgi:predicted hydrocarbon binding protein
MANKKNPKSGEDFTELSVRISQTTFQLCNETYAATKNPPAPANLRDLIERAEAHISEYRTLLEEYTGGRREAMQEAGRQIVRLVEFTATLKTLTKS